MGRSVSARIFAGFLGVILAFGAVNGYTVYRMHRVRRELELIGTRYLRLTLAVGELHIVQRSLLFAIGERSTGAEVSQLVRRQVQIARKFRLHEVRQAERVVRATEGLALDEQARRTLERTRVRLHRLQQAFGQNEPAFEALFATGADAASSRQRAATLARSERTLAGAVRRLRNDLRAQLDSTAAQVQQDQRYGLWAGIVLVAMALGMGIVVTLLARRTLRPLQTLVAGTKRIASGDFGQRVPVESDDELGALAREFNTMADGLQEREQQLVQSERMAAAGVLAAHITHEVRNPLNAISLNTEILDEELGRITEPAVDESRALCKAIQAQVDRLTAITEDYLRFARLPKAKFEEEDINAVLSSLVEFASGDMHRHGVRCAVHLAPGMPRVKADEGQLRQAFLNLLRNATEAFGGREGTVTVSTQLRASEIEIRVADDGPGIGDDDLRHIFEPFFTTKEHGTGLGLALTKQIIEEHGGSITVRSALGDGTVFAVVLPASQVRDSLNLSLDR